MKFNLLILAFVGFFFINGLVAEDICKLPKKTGPCVGYFFPYYYNSGKQMCEQFRFGGCMGNKNNFPTKRRCEETCLH